MSGCSQPTSQPEATLPPNLHLLIVEDVPADAELIVLTLETAQISFTYALVDTLEQCRQRLQTEQWDAVLSDFRLHGFVAYSVLETLQAVGQQIPLILITGSLGEESAVDCIKAGMTDYVLKDRLFRLPMVLERSLREFEMKRQQQLAIAQIQQQAMREAIINRIMQAMRETLVLDEVLQTTADMVHDSLQPGSCVIVYPGTNDEMIVGNVSKASPENWQQLLNKPCGIFPFYREQLLRGTLIVVNRIDNSLQPALQELAAEYRVSAFLMIPLMYQQEYLGEISVYQVDHPREWTVDEVAMLQAISDQCAIAIHQTQLFSQMQQQTIQEQLLNQIGQALNSSLDPSYILQGIVRLTGECFRVDRVLLFAIHANQIRMTHEWLANLQIPSMLDFTAEIEEWRALVDPFSGNYSTLPFHAPDFAAAPSTSAQLKMHQQNQTRSVVSVPIFIRDEFFGGIDLHMTTALRTFTEDEIHLLQRIADQAAIALYNAQSYERLEQTVRDRTYELEAEKLLSDSANRAKSEFLANMSHELRTPLTGILGFSSILLKQIFGSLTEKQQQYIENIHDCGEHLLSLINDLLDLSKIEAGREELILESVNIQEVCEACLSSIREQAETQGLQLALTIASQLDACTADRRRLKQILLNLLSNAVKFTEQGSVTLAVELTNGNGRGEGGGGRWGEGEIGEIGETGETGETGKVKEWRGTGNINIPHFPLLPSSPLLLLLPPPPSSPFSPAITFYVIDTGIGISPASLSFLFQPFQQLDGGLDRKYQGTGLGLVLARKLTQLHGGDITVTSTPGKGSCFALHLPL